MRIHHVGYLTKKLPAARKRFIQLGFQVEKEISYDAYREIMVEFLINGVYRIELIEPKRGGYVVSIT